MLTDLQTINRQGEFYQQISQELIRGCYSREALNRLAGRLITLAHHAYTLRQMDVVEQAGLTLLSLPVSQRYRSIGHFYKALCLKRSGHLTEARTLLEKLTDEVPYQYRGRVIMSLAGLVFDNGEYESALPLYVQASRAAWHRNSCDWFTVLTTQRMLAVLKSIDGDNRRA